MMGNNIWYLIFLSRLVEMMEGNVADKTRSGSEWGLKPAISFGHFRVFLFKSLSLYLNWMKGQILAFSQKKSWRFLKESPPFHVSCLSPIAVFAFMGKLAFPPHNAQCCNTFVNNISLLVLLLLHSILSTLWANCISHQSTKLFNFLSLLGEL